MTHFLVVTEPVPLYFEHEIEHNEDCPIERHFVDDGFLDGILRERKDYICPLGKYVSYWGTEDLIDDPRYNISGKYEIDFYEYWSGSFYDDSEAYIYFVE